MRRAGLKIIETLLESHTVLIANRASAGDPAKRKAMEQLQILLLGAMAARGRVLVKLNVGAADLDNVVAILPAMKAPTISKLTTEDSYAVETVVNKSEINVLIPQLKERGASDIIELPLSKIVP
ncbi:MAG: hypothetical protein LC663_01070 [Actinobacteria bacterium]|nr:hypothetical protein [Actinomycetota bacterium]